MMRQKMNIIQIFEKFAELGAEWVMWLMIILGFLMIIIAIERLFLLNKTKVDAPAIARQLLEFLDKNQPQHAKKILTDGLAMEQRVLADGLSQYHRGAVYVEQIMLSTLAREKQRYNRYLSYFGTLGNNTPFIGLFGTVIGIILAFKKLGENPKGGLEVIGPLISEALVATAVGLFVAIPAVVIFNWFKSEVKERVSNTDFLMRIVMAHLGQTHQEIQHNFTESLDFSAARVESRPNSPKGKE